MKLLVAIFTLAVLTGCASAPNVAPVQVTSSGIGVTASGLPVTSGNFAGIENGAAGTGSSE